VSRIFVAVAWPYANGPFHIGHLAGAYLPGDIFARFHRLRGDEVLMVSGSDMHGTPVLVTAEREGRLPSEIAGRYDAVNRAAFRSLGVDFDVFTSTHTPLHERTVHEVFLSLLRNGYIDRRTEEYGYCPKHARFLPDRYLTGICPNCGSPDARGDECDRCGHHLEPREIREPRCAICGTPAEFRPSEHFFLRLDKLAEPLGRFLADKQYWRPNVLRFTQNFRDRGLRPTPITRDLDWGIPIPLDGYPSKRFYVWFEAVIGYLSASREWAIRQDAPDAWRRFWEADAPVKAYYFVGKDNIYHHTIFWPAMLLGLGGYQLPFDVPANEWLVVGGGKLSKSRSPGASVSIPEMLKEYPADAIRFYAALLAPQNHDTEFQWEEFQQVTDQVLANQWGNLVQRLLVFAREKYGGRIPDPPADWSPERSPVGVRLREAQARIEAEYSAVHLKEALELALAEVREANRRFHEAKPWQAPDEERRRTVYEGIWGVRAAAVWLAPVLPTSSGEVFRMLGYPGPPGPGAFDHALDPPPAGQPLGDIHPLFPRAERSAPAPAGPVPAPSAPPPGTAPGAALAPLEIRAARILSVEPHPSADRLYRLEVDIGPAGTRTIVAGLRAHLAPEALQGQRILLLANLKPRTIRSVTSHGMLLAAESGGIVSLLHPPSSAALGDVVDGVSPPAREVTVEELEATPLRVGRVLGPAGPGESRVSVGDSERRVPGAWAEGRTVVLRTYGEASPRAEVISFGRGQPAEAESTVAPGAKVR
jgi:methionyl-tRNA synthetase